MHSKRYPLWLLGIFSVYWVAWGISPLDRSDWILENILTLLWVGLLWATWRRFPLSNISYTLIFVHVSLHVIGSHYTYEKVPYDAWFSALTGQSMDALLGFERNQFDRLVHFCFGFLLAYPAREVFVRISGVRGFWGYYLPVDVVMAFSMVYELVEWAVAVLLGGELGQAYLGSQGDVWDAHKDMALATLGAVITMLVVAWINWKFDRNFGAEFKHSLSVKEQPLGERKLSEIINQ